MRTFIVRGLTLSVTCYTLLHFISFFVHIQGILLIVSMFGLLTLFFSCLFLPGKQFRLPLFLMVAAMCIFLTTGNGSLENILKGLLQMRSLIALLLIVPIISWILKEEPYIDEIMSYAHNLLNNSRKFYFGLMGITQIIAYFLLFGAIPMMYHFITTFLKDYNGEAWENFKGTALLRAFALSTLWVISIPSFIFAVEALQASLWISILQGLLISICGILLAVCFSYFQEKKYNVNISDALRMEINRAMENSPNHGKWNPQVIEFSILFVSLFGTIFILHGIWNLELLLIIPLVIIVWTCLYYIWKKKTVALFIEAKAYFKSGIAKQAQQFSILLSAGLLIYSLNESGLGNYLVQGIYYLTNLFPILNFLFLLPFVVILLGFLGLGPLTVIVLVAGILENVSLPYPPELIVLSITSGSVISILLSPFIMPVIILSNSNKLSGFKNGLQFNSKYALLFYIIVQLYIQTMIHFWA